ncbi:MAG: alpha/beta hydrolase [Myxococcaceae bacterium]|nr:alpha/beta hydrolase [Myxococcaceae bacterium]
MNRLRANGLEFAYLEWGTGPNLLVLAHGFPDTPHTWSVIGPRLAALGYRVVAPWLRGYAPTSLPPRDTTSRDLGEDVIGWLDALGAKQAVLVGHDWGVEAVTAAVGLAPDRVSKLAIIGVPHRTQLPLTPRVAWAGRHFMTFRLPGAVARFAANDFAMVDVLCKRWSPTWAFGPDEVREVKRSFAVPGSAHAALGYYRAVSAITPQFMKARIAVPTLAIVGEQDPAVSVEDFVRGKRHFTGPYEVAAIPGGHFCHRESPEQAVDALTKLLQR